MSTLIPDSDDHAPVLDYAAAEGLDGADPSLYAPDAERDRRSWIFVAIGLVGLVALIAILVAIVALATRATRPPRRPLLRPPPGTPITAPPPPLPPPRRRPPRPRA